MSSPRSEPFHNIHNDLMTSCFCLLFFYKTAIAIRDYKLHANENYMFRLFYLLKLGSSFQWVELIATISPDSHKYVTLREWGQTFKFIKCYVWSYFFPSAKKKALSPSVSVFIFIHCWEQDTSRCQVRPDGLRAVYFVLASCQYQMWEIELYLIFAFRQFR